MKNIKLTFLLLLAILTSCVEDDNFDAPNLSNLCDNTTYIAKEINQIIVPTLPTLYTQDDVLEGYVVSSDEEGNFYKSISIQKEDGSIGLTIPVDQTNLHAEFKPGTKVAIKLKDKYIGKSHDMFAIGSLYEGEVGRISATQYKNVILRKCEGSKTENELVKVRTIAEAKNNALLNTFIEVENVQFSDESLNKKFYDLSVFTIGGGTNHTLLQVTGGTSVILRVSEYASFANKTVPSGSGKIRGIMTKYGSDYQFMVKSYNDIQLNDTRQTIDLSPPKGGTTITYSGNFTENFESYTTGVTSEAFPKYVNDADKGSKYWRVASFSNNKYIQMSAFSSAVSGQEQLNRTLFIVPVDFTAANSMSFKTKDGFNNGGVLKVYTTINYIPLSNINNATLTNISSNFTIASGTTSGYAANFTNSGTYNFPANLTGNGFIMFEYTGGYSFTPALTTTIQIDDIIVN